MVNNDADSPNVRWILDFHGPHSAMLNLAQTLKSWADSNNLEFSYTDMPDNEYGLPVLALVPKTDEGNK